MIKGFKRGQIGETTTWIVATVVIVVILGISIFLANSVFNIKNLEHETQKDSLASKSFFAYLLTDSVYEELMAEGDFNENTGNYALDVFGTFEEDYSQIWLGDVPPAFFSSDISLIENQYFGRYPLGMSGGNLLIGAKSAFEEVRLTEEKDFALVFLK